ncbi:MAG: carboxypeptidase regulatory-like domain-containing protein [Fimbriimonadaceae bacterium]|nr:carboxypeptidase regulatory-like domain-containing protein [Fimbriimonadaceae bacterium]
MRRLLPALPIALLLTACGGGGNINTLENITGRILSGSDAVPGVTVTLTGTSLTTTTDAAGLFALRGVPAGNWTVTAELLSSGRLRRVESRLFEYDGRHQVALGDLVLRSVDAATSGVGEVTGRVVDLAGVALPGATVELRRGGGALVATAITAYDGGFVLRELPAGSFSLLASATVGGSTLSGQRDDLSIGTTAATRLLQNASLVAAAANRLGTLQGTVTDRSALPIAGAQVAVGFSVAGHDGVAFSYTASSDATGGWVLTNVPVITGGVPLRCTAAGFATAASTVRPTAGAVVTADFSLAAADFAVPQAPTQLTALATTWPLGSARSAAFVAAARRRSLGRGAAVAAAPSRLAPSGYAIEVAVGYRPASGGDLTGQVLYRSHQEKNLDQYVAVARSAQPQQTLLSDASGALSVGSTAWYRLTSRGSRGNESDLSAAVSVKPLPQLTTTAPRAGETGVALTNTTFRWNLLPVAAGYQVLLYSALPGPDVDPVLTSAVIPGRTAEYTYSGPALAASAAYYWLVVAFDKADPSTATAESYSALNTFTTAAAP